MARTRKFGWDAWDFDGDGNAYIIAKDLCPSKEDVPKFIVKADGIHPDCMAEMNVQEGWCKYMVRSDWDNVDGPCGGYYVENDLQGRLIEMGNLLPAGSLFGSLGKKNGIDGREGII